MIDIHRDKMSRKEFCWLTDPRPPLAETRSETSLVLKWDPIRFCGVDVSVVSDSITYILEGCEGQEWKGGIASKFVSDISSSEYKLICKGPQLERIVLEDLKPARWYHFRLTIKYLSTYVTSQTKSYATICSPPNKPNIPYVYLVINENNMFENKSRKDPQVRLSWNEPSTNGSSIKKYQVQVMDFYENISHLPKSRSNNHPTQDTSLTNPHNNNNNNNSNNNDYDDNNNDNDMNIQRPPPSPKSKQLYKYSSTSGQILVGEKWKTVYCNLVKSTLLEPPKPGCHAWGIRIRALNTSGWSSFSDTIFLDHDTYPQVFQFKLPSPTREKLPPLQKSYSRADSGASSTSKSPSKHSQNQTNNNNNNNHHNFQATNGQEYHDNHVDMWTAANQSNYSTSSKLSPTIEENGNSFESNSRSLSRSQSAPHAKYNQPRCKSPTLLLPGSQSLLSKNNNNEGFTRSVSPNPQSSFDSFQSSENSELSPLDIEVERYIIQTNCFNLIK